MSQAELTRKLFKVCQDQDQEQVKNLIELGGDPSLVISERGEYISALHLVCRLGDLKGLKVLVETSKQVNFGVRGGRKGLTPLHYACLYGHLDICNYLIDQKCDPNSETSDGDTALHMACRYPRGNALEIVTVLIKIAKCDINARNRNGNTPLMVLQQENIRSGRDETVHFTMAKYLLFDGNCDVSLTNNDGNTALHLACTAGNQKIVQLILITRSGLLTSEISNNEGNLPLHLACLKGHYESTEVITRANSDCLYAVNKANKIPLQIALNSNSDTDRLLSLLISQMYKCPDKSGNSPLHLACLTTNIQLARVIVGVKCDPNLTNRDGDTPLHLACRSGSVLLTELLLEMNCDLNVENKDGDTALTTVIGGMNYLLIRLFQKKGVRNDCGESPFFIACKIGNTELISLLLKLKWDSDEANNDGTTPIQAAFVNGHLEIVKLIITNFDAQGFSSDILWLLERGFNPCSILKEFKTSHSLIHVVCGKMGDLNALKLLEERLNYYEVDGKGLTPLHYACYYGHLDIVKYLVNYQSCSPLVQDPLCQTPLHLACITTCKDQEKALEIVKFLTTSTHADCNALTLTGDSPLTLLLKTKHSWNNVVRFLIYRCHCDLSLKNDLGETALHIACTNGNAEATNMILETGIDPNIKDNAGNTPLDIACRKVHVEIVSQILSCSHCGVEHILQSVFTNSMNILHIVCGPLGDIDTLRLLAQYAAYHLMPKDENGWTPLHYACTYGHLDIITYLVME